MDMHATTEKLLETVFPVRSVPMLYSEHERDKANFLHPEKYRHRSQGSVLGPLSYSLHRNDGPAAPRTHLALFADDTSIYATEKHERRILCKLQRGLTVVKSWRER
jgi:hypothetical protein